MGESSGLHLRVVVVVVSQSVSQSVSQLVSQLVSQRGYIRVVRGRGGNRESSGRVSTEDHKGVLIECVAGGEMM